MHWTRKNEYKEDRIMLLEVKDLETEFKVKRGTVKAVNGVSF